VLERERPLGEVIAEAFNLYLASWTRYAAVVAPAILVGIAWSLLLFAFEDNPELSALVYLIGLPINFIAYQLVSAAVIALLVAVAAGRDIAAGDALDTAQDRLSDVISASLRSVAIVFLFAITVIGIPFAIYRIVRWALIIQVVMVEGVAGEPSLARSAALVKGQWWRTFGRLLVSGLVVGLPLSILAQLILTAFPGVFGTILSATTGFVIFPFGIIATSLIYFDLKARESRRAQESRNDSISPPRFTTP
jgi:hypothetical protein